MGLRAAVGCLAAVLGLAASAGAAAADPPFPLGAAQLAPSDPLGTTARFGTAVALSADGDTAVVGAPGVDPVGGGAVGGAWAFTRAEGRWTEQRLTAPDETTYAGFGSAVAVSADGSTVLVGGPSDGFLAPGGAENGAVWVFTRTADGWTEQSKLTPTDAAGANVFFGAPLALSADGRTALIGGRGDNGGVGAAWVFVRTAGGWMQQGAKLTAESAAAAADFGHSAALSGDGTTALVGGDVGTGGASAVWDFSEQGGVWTRGAGHLIDGAASPCANYASAGTGLALSGDGSTALVGGAAAGDCAGGAWVFTRAAGGAWAQQGPELTPSDAAGLDGQFGWSTALSESGDSALIGGWGDSSSSGSAWVFTRSGTTWAQDGSKLAPGVAGDQAGFAVALSGDGATALTGANEAGAGAGAAWVFTMPPVIAALGPVSGPAAGRTTVTITGTGLENVDSVHFGAAAAVPVRAVSPTEVTAVSPRGLPGAVAVTVTTDRGTSASTAAAQFTYDPEPPKLSHVRESHRRWRVGTQLARVSAASGVPSGTTFAFTLSEPAAIALKFTSGGRRRPGGTLRLAAPKGRDRIVFEGRLSRRRRLAPGAYVVTVTATDRAGRSSKATRLKFTVIRG